MKIIDFIVNYRFVIAFVILVICLLFHLFTMFPLIQKFKSMEDIPIGEAEAEARFNEINKRNKSVKAAPEEDESDEFFDEEL
ncbi:MAG: hypothetical protein IKJ03_01430 [Mycoplasmataceae bacterium]|nr:hypothetical protein [Mycoplasmataceae bacterium]